MTDRAVQNDGLFGEIHRLVTACLEGNAPETTFQLLGDMVSGDARALDIYVEYLSDSMSLRCVVSPPIEAEVMTRALTTDMESDPPLKPSLGPSPNLESAPGFPATTIIWHGTVNYFSSGWPLAYLIATVIFTTGLLVAGFTYISQPAQVAERPPTIMKGTPTSEPKMELVGRITGMVDCRWADKSMAAFHGAHVPLGRKFALASGVMEITYNTGAKVILQGPATYCVESWNGGFLPLGKLTGKVESGPAKGFSVRTLTAVITDLGTEFGVEANPSGGTEVVVFQGVVELAQQMDGRERKQLLKTGEAVRLENTGAVTRTDRSSLRFVRVIPRGPETFSISTADGCGADAYVRDGEFRDKNMGCSEELSVKNTTVPGVQRKVYLRFDVGSLARHKVIDARLELATGITDRSQPYVFRVYGLRDGAPGDGRPEEGGWREGRGKSENEPADEGITWATAPANQTTSGSQFTDDAVLLGEFQLTSNMMAGYIITFADPRLADWLNTKTNGTATLMVARKTQGQKFDDLLHVFGSKEHSYLPRPRLLIRTIPGLRIALPDQASQRATNAVNAVTPAAWAAAMKSSPEPKRISKER